MKRPAQVGLSVLGVVGVGGAIVGVILYASTNMRDATHRFLGHLRAHHDAEAYAMTSADFQARVPLAAFTAYVDQNAPHSRGEDDWINGFSSSGEVACMDIWVGSGISRDTVYVMLEDGGRDWRIDDVTENEPELCDNE
jgi:hypothetical protein